MITNIPFDSLIYTLFLKGFLKVNSAIDNFAIPGNSTIKIDIPVANRFEAIPYEIKIIPDRDDVLTFKFYIDNKTIIHDERVKLSSWLDGLNFLNKLKVILYAKEKFTLEIYNRSSDEQKFTIFFIYAEVREDIKEKILNTYFLSIYNQFEEITKKIEIKEFRREEKKERIC